MTFFQRTALLVVAVVWSLSSFKVSGQATVVTAPAPKWYDRVNIRGYTQFRYNRLFETNPNLNCEQCDRNWGNNRGFGFRRIRIIFFGQISERLYYYIQPDFASTAGTTNNVVQVRDAYLDLGLSKENELRVRLGQSKIPYGFENMQSSQNRLPLDRNDALNSAAPNERDMGVFLYYAPAAVRKRFSTLVSSGLKGSGDYGMIGVGVYNGQGTNATETNNNRHIVGHLTYPFEAKNGQLIEVGAHAYTGQTTITRSNKTSGPVLFPDRRLAGSLTIYPQPLGLQAEYNIGEGPEYVSATNTVETKPLRGGYALLMYMAKLPKGQILIPFVRYQTYQGGKKFEIDARSYDVKDLELGAEWQPFKTWELVGTYTISNRRYEDGLLPNNRQKGNLLRLQLQLNI